MTFKPLALAGAAPVLALDACSIKRVDKAPAGVDMQVAPDKLVSLGGRPIETPSPADALLQPGEPRQ